MKKISYMFLVFFIALTFLAGSALAAQPEYKGEMNQDFYVMLIDADTGKVLYEQGADQEIKPASTTKIMTTIIALENSSLSDIVTIPAECDWSSKPGDYSKLDVRRNEEITMKDLVYGMMIVSGDDAADAIAIKVGGSIEGFVNMMNDKAQELGMTSTHFANAGGLDKEDPHVTVRDMSKLAIYAMKNPDFRDIVSRATYDMQKTNKHDARTVLNTNKLLDSSGEFYYEYTTGIKTGSTPKAGGCLVSSASKDGMNLICLVYGEMPSTKTQRWVISKSLLEWGLENFKTIDISSLIKTDKPITAQIQGYDAGDAQKGLLEFKQPEGGSIMSTVPKDIAQALLGGTDTIEAATAYSRELTAPVAEGETLGTVIYTVKSTGEEIYSYDLIAAREILMNVPASSTQTPAASPETTPTQAPTPMPTITSADTAVHTDNSLLLIIVSSVAVLGLITFIVIRLIMANKRRNSKKRRRQIYSYRK